MEMVLEGSILQMMATVLKLLPIEDLIKHFCIYYSHSVNRIMSYYYIHD